MNITHSPIAAIDAKKMDAHKRGDAIFHQLFSVNLSSSASKISVKTRAAIAATDTKKVLLLG